MQNAINLATYFLFLYLVFLRIWKKLSRCFFLFQAVKSAAARRTIFVQYSKRCQATRVAQEYPAH